MHICGDCVAVGDLPRDACPTCGHAGMTAGAAAAKRLLSERLARQFRFSRRSLPIMSWLGMALACACTAIGVAGDGAGGALSCVKEDMLRAM